METMALSFVLLFVAAIQQTISKPYDVTVTDARADSVDIHWKTTQSYSMIDHIKLTCNGISQYPPAAVQLLDTDEKVRYYGTSSNNHVTLGELKANFNYSCTLWEYIYRETNLFHAEISGTFYFRTDYADSVMDPGYLNVTDHTVLVTLVVFIPLVLVGCLATTGIVVFCVIRKHREKIKHSRRDVVAAFAIRRAQQQGIHLPYHQLETVEEGDLPWLNPFSSQTRMPSPSLSLSNQELHITETGQSSELPVIMEDSIQLQDHWESGTAGLVDEPLLISGASDNTLTMISTVESSSTCEKAPQVVPYSIMPADTSKENLTTVTVPLSVSIDVWTTPNTSPSNSTASIGTGGLFDITSQSDQSHTSLHPPLSSVMSHHSHLSDKEARTGRDMNNIDHPIQELKHSKIESSTLFTSSTQLSIHSIGGHVNSKSFSSNKSSNDASTENTSQHYQEGPESNLGNIGSVSFHHSKSMFDIKDECLYEAYLQYQKCTAVNIDCDECMDEPVSTLSNTSIIKSPSEVSCWSDDYYSADETLEFSS